MKRFALLAVISLFVLSLSAAGIDQDKEPNVIDQKVEMELVIDLAMVDRVTEFGISKSEPVFKNEALVADNIGEVLLEKEEKGGALKEKVVLYPYWILILTEDVDLEVSGGPFKRRNGANVFSFDWRGDSESSSNDSEISSKPIVIGLENGSTDYSGRIVYSHRAASGLKSAGFASLTISTEDVSGYPAGQYEAELIMRLIRN